MKNLITNFVLIFLTSMTVLAQSSVAEVQADDSGDLTVELRGLSSDEGSLAVALYDSSKNWLGKRVMGEVTQIVDGKATVIFKAVPYGTYAISSFHDENNNEELDAGLFGIPKEPYASSRGAKGMFGPPQWEDAKFELDQKQLTETIKF